MSKRFPYSVSGPSPPPAASELPGPSRDAGSVATDIGRRSPQNDGLPEIWLRLDSGMSTPEDGLWEAAGDADTTIRHQHGVDLPERKEVFLAAIPVQADSDRASCSVSLGHLHVVFSQGWSHFIIGSLP